MSIIRFFFDGIGTKKKLSKKKCRMRLRGAAPLRVERPLLRKTVDWCKVNIANKF